MRHLHKASSLFALSTVLLASQAFADPIRIESIRKQQIGAHLRDNPCTKPYNDAATAVWSEGEVRVLKLTNEGKVQFEVFGHWIDTWHNRPNKIDAKGIEARYLAGISGTVNNLRGCGAIGSAIIELTIPEGNKELKFGELIIADARKFFIELHPLEVHDLKWDNSNQADGTHNDGSSSYAQRLAAYQQNLPALTAAYQTCLQERQAQVDAYNARVAAAAASGDKMVTLPGGPRFKVCREPKPPQEVTNRGSNRTLPSCGDRFGLIGLVQDNYIDITLPSSGITQECAQKPLPLEFSWNWPWMSLTQGSSIASGDIVAPINYLPASFTITGTGPLPRIVVPSGQRSIGSGEVNVQFNAQDLTQLVGEYERRITHDQGSSATLVIRSTPNYGVARLAGPLFQNLSGAAGTRTASTGRLTMTSVQATKQGQVFKWTLAGASAAQCFRSTNGTLPPTSNTSSVTFEIEATNQANCDGQTFTVTIGPQGKETDPTFARSTTFTLPTFNRPLVPQNDKPKITVPAGIRAN